MTMISTWLPKVMRSGTMKNAAIATSHGSASAVRKRWRLSKYSAARSRACPRLIMASLAAIEPCRFHQEDGHGNRVDEKSAGVREQIFSGGVEDAQHQRGEQRAFQAAQSPDRDDNQEQHEIKHRKTGREAQ